MFVKFLGFRSVSNSLPGCRKKNMKIRIFAMMKVLNIANWCLGKPLETSAPVCLGIAQIAFEHPVKRALWAFF